MLVEQVLPIARERLFIVRADAPLIQAASLLGDIESDLLVVCDDHNHLIGVITKTDVVRKIGKCCGSACGEITATAMKGDVVSCKPNARLEDIWLAMKERRLKNVPVVDTDATPLGVLNARDVLELLLSEAEQEDNLLRDYVACSGYH
jgi:CBS domain-containing protein